MSIDEQSLGTRPHSIQEGVRGKWSAQGSRPSVECSLAGAHSSSSQCEPAQAWEVEMCASKHLRGECAWFFVILATQTGDNFSF